MDKHNPPVRVLLHVQVEVAVHAKEDSSEEELRSSSSRLAGSSQQQPRVLGRTASSSFVRASQEIERASQELLQPQQQPGAPGGQLTACPEVPDSCLRLEHALPAASHWQLQQVMAPAQAPQGSQQPHAGPPLQPQASRSSMPINSQEESSIRNSRAGRKQAQRAGPRELSSRQRKGSLTTRMTTGMLTWHSCSTPPPRRALRLIRLGSSSSRGWAWVARRQIGRSPSQGPAAGPSPRLLRRRGRARTMACAQRRMPDGRCRPARLSHLLFRSARCRTDLAFTRPAP